VFLFYVPLDRTKSTHRCKLHFLSYFTQEGTTSIKTVMLLFYLRITVNGKRSELNIKRKVLLTKWNSEGGKVRGTTSSGSFIT